jgi:four helix bundle protein
MTEQEFKKRTKALALEVIKFVDELPRSRSADVLTGQLLRSATAVAANYRSACRAKSMADMISKLATVEEEADESGFWMELLVDSGKARAPRLADLRDEAEEILAMTVASIKTLRRKTYTRAQEPESKQRQPKLNLKSKIQNPKYGALCARRTVHKV